MDMTANIFYSVVLQPIRITALKEAQESDAIYKHRNTVRRSIEILSHILPVVYRW